jgi:hypothetical protein
LTKSSPAIDSAEAAQLARLYQARFSATEVAAKDRVWAILCHDFFSRFVRPTDTVLDIAAGYCEFINHIECAHKVALDANPDIARYATFNEFFTRALRAGARAAARPSAAGQPNPREQLQRWNKDTETHMRRICAKYARKMRGRLGTCAAYEFRRNMLVPIRTSLMGANNWP